MPNGAGAAGDAMVTPVDLVRREGEAPFRIRRLRTTDLSDIVRIDAEHTGTAKDGYWEALISRYVDGVGEPFQVALVAEAEGSAVGYLFAELRAFEFGAEPSAWIFAVGVDPARRRQGIASGLLDEASRLLRDGGVRRLRTLVRGDDPAVRAFFEASGFSESSLVVLDRRIGRRRRGRASQESG